MRIDEIFPNVETCKKLKELGFPQETYFSYVDKSLGIESYRIYPTEETDEYYSISECACPTFSEIWKELPYSIQDEITFYLTMDKGDDLIGYLWTGFSDSTHHKDFIILNIKNISEAAAQLWIKLKESNKI